ncbi:hypothetical protein BKM63_13800 [Flavobacterium johnsoniae]|jgi:hypothetical protein|uniref:Uncharacterized protein n=1 Tax=Flavobacterium johnsoniae TaxID=986 RepID=A0A1J7BSC4_FLAJO|nr:hypothetical protein BKM63_13800 [Flavobacterium johnsoniae]
MIGNFQNENKPALQSITIALRSLPTSYPSQFATKKAIHNLEWNIEVGTKSGDFAQHEFFCKILCIIKKINIFENIANYKFIRI